MVLDHGRDASFWKKARTGMFGGQKIKVRLSYWPIENWWEGTLEKGLQVPQKALKGEFVRLGFSVSSEHNDNYLLVVKLWMPN